MHIPVKFVLSGLAALLYNTAPMVKCANDTNFLRRIKWKKL